MNRTVQNIMQQLIEKGGLYGMAAKSYINDLQKSRQFILECYEQCHLPEAKVYWGEQLLNDIIHFASKAKI